MKKIVSLLITASLILMCLAGCGKAVDNTELEAYKTSMESFFTALEKANTDINAIDATDQDAINSLFEQFDILEKEFNKMAELKVPTENVPDTFVYIEALADEAAKYMTDANNYLKQSFDGSSYNENTVKPALECYQRANKRVLYIIDLLHGELPKDDNISYTNQ